MTNTSGYQSARMPKAAGAGSGAPEIGAQYEVLESTITSFADFEEEFHSLVSDLSTATTELMSTWQGVASGTAQEAITLFEDCLSMISGTIDFARTSIIEAEETMKAADLASAHAILGGE